MGLSQAELNRLIFENYPPAGAPDMFAAFDGAGDDIRARTQRIATAQEADIAAIESDGEGLSPQEMRDLSAKLAKMETEDEMKMALSGILSGRAMVNYFSFLDKRLIQTKADNAKARQDAFYLALLQAQLDALNIEIGNLEDALSYLTRTGDVEGTMEKPGVNDAIEAWENRTGKAFDPNDPNAGAILKGIIEDDIKAKKEQKAEVEQQAQRLNHEIDQEIAEKAAASREVAEFAQTRSGRDGLISQVQYDEREEVLDKAIQATSDVEDAEQRLLKLEDLKQFKGQPDYIEKIDTFIAGADERTIASLVDDPNVPEEVLERVAVFQFNQMYERIQSLQGTENYDRALKGILARTNETTRQALVDDENAPQDIVAAIYEMHTEKQVNTAETSAEPSDERPVVVASTETSILKPGI